MAKHSSTRWGLLRSHREGNTGMFDGTLGGYAVLSRMAKHAWRRRHKSTQALWQGTCNWLAGSQCCPNSGDKEGGNWSKGRLGQLCSRLVIAVSEQAGDGWTLRIMEFYCCMPVHLRT